MIDTLARPSFSARGWRKRGLRPRREMTGGLTFPHPPDVRKMPPRCRRRDGGPGIGPRRDDPHGSERTMSQSRTTASPTPPHAEYFPMPRGEGGPSHWLKLIGDERRGLVRYWPVVQNMV